MKDLPASPRKTARQIACEEALAVKAQEAFKEQRIREKEKARKLEAKRKREEEALLADQLEDFDLVPPPPPKIVNVARKTVLMRGKTKRQASVEPSILDAADTLASLNMRDMGGCDDSDAMSSSHESENKAKKFEESSLDSASTCSGTSWDSGDIIASAVTKK